MSTRLLKFRKQSSLPWLAITISFCGVLILTPAEVNQAQDEFSQYVDPNGSIAVPESFRTEWVFLGTWSVAAEAVEASAADSGHGAAALHNVYTQPGTVEAFRKTGKFPDGAVLVKELLTTDTAPMTTGQVSRGAEIEGWFIMIKDTVGRFRDNKLWGNGWGWALFDANKNLKTKDYEAECIGCHVPAERNDWVYVEGYPILRKP